MTPNRSVCSRGNQDDTTGPTQEESIFVPAVEATTTHRFLPILGSLVHSESTTEDESMDTTVDCSETTQV